MILSNGTVAPATLGDGYPPTATSSSTRRPG
jgi:hypothetical protein